VQNTAPVGVEFLPICSFIAGSMRTTHVLWFVSPTGQPGCLAARLTIPKKKKIQIVYISISAVGGRFNSNWANGLDDLFLYLHSTLSVWCKRENRALVVCMPASDRGRSRCDVAKSGPSVNGLSTVVLPSTDRCAWIILAGSVVLACS